MKYLTFVFVFNDVLYSLNIIIFCRNENIQMVSRRNNYTFFRIEKMKQKCYI